MVVVGVEKDDHADVSSSSRPEGGVPGGGVKACETRRKTKE